MFCSVVKHVCLFVHYGATQNVFSKKPSKHHCSSKTNQVIQVSFYTTRFYYQVAFVDHNQATNDYHVGVDHDYHGSADHDYHNHNTSFSTTTTADLTMSIYHHDGADLDYHDVCGHHNYHSGDNYDYHAGVDHDYHNGCDHCDYDDGTDYNPHSLYSTDYCRVKG